MTQKQEYLRKGLLMKIHVHPSVKQRKELEVWQDFLFNSYGVRSSAELSIDELYNLLDTLNGRAEAMVGGIRPRKKRAAAKTKSNSQQNEKAKTAKQQIAKVKDDKPQNDKDEQLTQRQEAHLMNIWNLEVGKRGLTLITGDFGGFTQRTLGVRPLYLQNLTKEQATKLITGSEYLLKLKEHKKISDKKEVK